MLVGLPRGGTISPIVFNVVMADMVSVFQRDGIIISTAMYADDICLGAASDKMRPIINALQDTLGDLSAKLENIVLRIATEKSKFMVQRPPRKYVPSITLTVRFQPLQRAHQHRFLGLNAPRNNSIPRITNLLIKIKGRQLCHSESLQHAAGQCVPNPASATQCADRQQHLLSGALHQRFQVTAPLS